MLENIKNRADANDMQDKIFEFLNSRVRMYVSFENKVEIIELFNFKNKYYTVIAGFSNLHKKLKAEDVISAMICSNEGKRAKIHAQVSGEFTLCSVTDIPNVDDRMYKKMIAHKSDIFEIKPKNAKAVFSKDEMFDLNEEFAPSFAKFDQKGTERFENSRYIGMEYNDREVILNAVVEGEVYFALTNKQSNKIVHINNGGACKIYDGKNKQFDAKIEVLEDTNEIFEKLVATNNAYFKENTNLVGLKICAK